MEEDKKDPLREYEKWEEDKGFREEDIDDVLNFLNNLDYDEYKKDMELREALQLIKQKMWKEQKKKEDEAKLELNYQIEEKVRKQIEEEQKNKRKERDNEIPPEFRPANLEKSKEFEWLNFYKKNPLEVDPEYYKGLTEDEKKYLENHWNSSVKIEDYIYEGDVINKSPYDYNDPHVKEGVK